MGPHSFECGILAVEERRKRVSIASMGPHSFECGIDNHKRSHPEFPEHASMGPHSFECGIGTPSKESEIMAASFNGAALIRVRNTSDDHDGLDAPLLASMGPHSFECGILPWVGALFYSLELGLQWGRTHSSAEYNFYEKCDDGRIRGFNGAALIRVRNSDGSAGVSTAAGRASMGPHSFECGITFWPSSMSIKIWSFNGAALIRVRNS